MKKKDEDLELEEVKRRLAVLGCIEGRDYNVVVEDKYFSKYQLRGGIIMLL